MADITTQDILANSVTEGDIFPYRGGGVINLVMPWSGALNNLALPSNLPPYFSASTWTYTRDVVLRSTILHEPYWANAVSIAGAKESAKSFELTGDIPRRVQQAHQMLIQWGGNGYVQSQKLGVMDYLTTNNGEFWEIVRQSSAAGSRIVGLVHLDSLRCRRTGDPDMPVIYYDLRGRPHELRDYQVVSLVDMPDPSYPIEGIGHCAAERVYPIIYKLSGMITADNERIIGAGAHQLAVITGASPAQIAGVMITAKAEAQAKGMVNYQGTVIAGIQGDAPIDIKTLQLRGLPDNYNYKEQIDLAHLAYANSIGLVLTDLQPLSGQGLGTGTQAIVVEEKSQGRTLASRDKELTHLFNEWVMPDAVTFAFGEKDTRQAQAEANLAQTRASTRAAQITSGEITTTEARVMAADAGDIPDEFVPDDITPETSVDDEERTDEATEETPQPDQPPAQPDEARPEPATKEARIDYAAIKAQLLNIREALNA